jgi:hypothetical protein
VTYIILETRGQGCCFQYGNIVPVPVFSAVSNAASITATINQNGLVTASILENHNKDPLAHNLLAALHLWQPTHAYAVGDICYSSTGASYKYFECTVAGTSGATEPTWGAVGSTVTDGSAHWAVRDIKNTGVSIGTIMPFLATKAQPGWLACDTGALVSRAAYPDLWNWVKTNAPLLSEVDWQTQAASQSSVGAYSTGDGSTTFRLPKILDYIRGGAQADVGTWQGDAIRNITGSMAFYEMINYVPSAGVFKGTNTAGTNNARSTGQAGGTTIVTFDASSVVPTANENRPKTIKFLYCVKAFDAVTNQGMIDITELANEKADKSLSNVTSVGKKVMSGMSMPSATFETISITATSNAQISDVVAAVYIAPANGYVTIAGNAGSPSGAAEKAITLKTANGLSARYSQSNNGSGINGFIPIAKGDTCTILLNSYANIASAKFIYAKGEI